MARARTTFDTFNAIAEPKRRAIIEMLAGQDLTVNQLVDRTGWRQPTVSKHLGVLKEVGLVSGRKDGRKRVYQVNAVQLQPIQDWVSQFERLWNNRLDHLDAYLTDIQSSGQRDNE